MGHRANLVIVDSDGWRHYFAKSAANGIYQQLAAGPQVALAFVRDQEQLAPGAGWLDDVWAEGGVVIDTVARRLLWYGNDVMIELPLRRMFFRLLNETWPGWRVDWAYDGIGDIAAYVGVDREAVRALDMDELTAVPAVAYELDEMMLLDPAQPMTDEQGAYDLVTVYTGGENRAWVLGWGYDTQHAWVGPDILEQLPGPGFTSLRLAERPGAGMHIDVPARSIGVWTSNICPGLLQEELQARWPGWRTTFWHDQYERQLAAAQGIVTVPPCQDGPALEQLTKYLLEPVRDYGLAEADLHRIAHALADLAAEPAATDRGGSSAGMSTLDG